MKGIRLIVMNTNAASRADRAEATVDEKNDARDRADQKEERSKQ